MLLPPAPFSLQEARLCGNAVMAAYDLYHQWLQQNRPSPEALDWQPAFSAPGISPPIWAEETLLHWFGHAEPFAFVAQLENDDRLIAIRGTESGDDWIDDARASQMPFEFAQGNALVHAGFVQLYRSLRLSLLPALSALPGRGRILITGHSLGAALSLLTLAELAHHPDIPGTRLLHYSFAGPRVGDQAFSQLLHQSNLFDFHFVNTCDLVPQLPPAVLGNTLYTHTGVSLCFHHQGGSVAANHNLQDAYLPALDN